MSNVRPGPVDPAEAANEQVLAARLHRNTKRDRRKAAVQEAADTVIDELNPQPAAPAGNAVEFLSDAWDRGVFGDPIPTYRRLVYGPDPLLESCPQMRERIEQIGLESYAHATATAILTKGPDAVPDPIMKRGLLGAIERFGIDSVAQAFKERILKIPFREVEIEAEREDYIMLADPLRMAVERYGRPGMAPKFMSDRSIALLGDRGYQPVKTENGDIVKVGTLMMFEIPQRVADARKRRAAEESEQAVRDQENAYVETAERYVREAGRIGAGSRPLRADEVINANASETEEFVGQARPSGIQIERQR